MTGIQRAQSGLLVALEMESRGQSLYARAQRLVDDPSFLRLIKELEADEREHEKLFVRMLSELADADFEALPDEQKLLARSRAAEFFFPGGLMQFAMKGATGSVLAFLEEAMQAERDSIAFYERLLDDLEGEAHAAIARVIQEERRHLEILGKRKQMEEENT